MSKDTDLFFEGVKAHLIQLGGWILVFVGLITMISSGFIGFVLFAGGIAAIFWGKAKRFEYKRKSGHILHKGD